MMAMGSSSSSPPRRLTIFAGVQCYADEALVDTAAEEAVIGATALQELEKSLRQRNLKCIPVQGNSPLPSAGGVGGEAKVVKQLEVPVGVAQVNAVLRFTVLQDDDQSQTPPLLPVSFLEHIEATIDLKNNLLTTGQGQTASMRRLGTAHRAVSLTNFSPSGWNLPVSHRRDPDVDPFVLQPERPLHFHVAQYDPNTVTVWLLHQDQLHFLQSFPGSRYDMIFPQDCVGLRDTTSLEPERVTYARLEDGHRMVIRDQWNTHDKRYRSLQQPWTGAVVFASTSATLADFLSLGERLISTPPASAQKAFSSMAASSSSRPVAENGPWAKFARCDSGGKGRAAGTRDDVHDTDTSCSPTSPCTTSTPLSQSSLSTFPALQAHGSYIMDHNIEVSLGSQSPKSQGSCEHFFIGDDSEVELVELSKKPQARDARRFPLQRGLVDAAHSFPKPMNVFKSLCARRARHVRFEEPRSSDSEGARTSTRKEEDSSGSHYDGRDSLETFGAGDLCAVQEHAHGTHHGVPHQTPGHLRARDGGGPQEACQDQERGSRSMDSQDADWQAPFKVSGTKDLGQGSRRLQASRRSTSTPSWTGTLLVHLSRMWLTLGTSQSTSGSNLIKLFYADRPTNREEEQPTGVSEGASSTTLPCGSGRFSHQCAAEGEGDGATADTRSNPTDSDTTWHGGDGRFGPSTACQVPHGKNRHSTAGDVHDDVQGRVGGRHDGLSGSGGGRTTDGPWRALYGARPGGVPGPLKKHFATYEVKSLEQMKHEDASLHKTVHGIARSAFLLMISFVAAADASLAASTTVYEISNSDTFCFDQHKNFTAGVDNLDLLLGKPTHLLGSTDDGKWHPMDLVSPIQFLEQSQHPCRVCWVYPTNESNKWLGMEDHDWHRSPKFLPKNVKTFIHQAVTAKHGHQADVMEIYSPPRMTKEAKKQNEQGTLPRLRLGQALDLTTGWDFTRQAHRQAALRLIAECRPALLILSPPCTAFSTLRRLSTFKRDAGVVDQELKDALLHWHFAIHLARLQHRERRGFLLEHPRYAESWKDSQAEALVQLPGVYSIVVDMCAFQLYTDGGLAKKPTALVTNVWPLVRLLRKYRCDGKHSHQPLLGGGRAAVAAQYTLQFVRAVLQGLRHHLRGRGVDYVHVAEDPVLLPSELQDRVNYYARAWSQPLADYILEESHFQHEFFYMTYLFTAFPAHKILGRGDDVPAASGAAPSLPSSTSSTSAEGRPRKRLKALEDHPMLLQKPTLCWKRLQT